MKKLVMEGPKKCKFIDVDMPVIENDTDVLIKNRYCGVCMSEHYDWTTAKEGKSFGHEPIGTVVAVDIRKECLEDAKRYGADEVYTPDELPAHYMDEPGKDIGFQSQGLGFKTVMEWGETAESLDLAIRMTRMCGQLALGAYHTGGKRLVDIQQLNVKAIDCLSTHPREVEINRTACANAVQMLCNGSWDFKNVPTKVYPWSEFDRAQEELTTKYGKYMKAVVDYEKENFEPYIID